MDDSSDDSDVYESSRNVQSIVIKSRVSQEELDDYAYKRRLGDLIFDANFEGGNLGYVENIDRYEYDLMVRPDVSNARHRIWFNFMVSNQRFNQCVILTFANISENLRLFHEGYCPVIRSRKRPNWIILDEEQVFYYRSKNHGNRYVLSLAIRFSTQEDEHQLALFYPYTYTTLCNFLDRWQVELKRLQIKRAIEEKKMKKKHNDHGERNIERKRANISSKSPEPSRQRYHRGSPINQADDRLRTRSSLEVRCKTPNTPNDSYNVSLKTARIAESVLLQSIYCVSIDDNQDSNDTTTNSNRQIRPNVVIICRMGGGNLDSVSSFVCQGLMDYLLSDSLIASAARECIKLSIFPMLDPDSIFCGNSCTDLLGQQVSHNSAELFEANPEVYSNFLEIKQNLNSILSPTEGDRGRTIILEIRVELELMGVRILGSHFSDTLRMERHLSLPKAMSKYIDGFYLETCKFSSNKNVTHPSWLGQLISNSNNSDYYLMEVSPFGTLERSLDTRDYVRYDQVSYLTIGKAIIYSLVDMFRPKHTDHIASILDRFHHHSNDIEQLTLNMAKLQQQQQQH